MSEAPLPCSVPGVRRWCGAERPRRPSVGVRAEHDLNLSTRGARREARHEGRCHGSTRAFRLGGTVPRHRAAPTVQLWRRVMMRSRTFGGAAAALVVIGVMIGPGLAGAATQQASFTTPGTSSFTVPQGICSVAVDASGAQGGNGAGGAGGLGGR